MPFKVRIGLGKTPLSEVIFSQIEERFLTAGRDLADELEWLSPVGGTGELRRGWRVSSSNGEGRISVRITNVADDSLQRVSGSAPGTRPDLPDLTQWVEAKKIARGRAAKKTALAVARKIEREGTQRWREGGNQDMGIGRKG